MISFHLPLLPTLAIAGVLAQATHAVVIPVLVGLYVHRLDPDFNAIVREQGGDPLSPEQELFLRVAMTVLFSVAAYYIGWGLIAAARAF